MLTHVKVKFTMLSINCTFFFRAVIHLGVHLHLVVDGRCKEVVDGSKKLIEEEVN